MPFRNLVSWNTEPHPRLLGYSVTTPSGPTFTASSSVFYDPYSFGTYASAEAATYTVSPIISTAGPQPPADDIPTPVLIRVAVWPINTAAVRLCTFSGNVTSLGVMPELRTRVRFMPYSSDMPLMANSSYMNADEVTVITNYRGDFTAYLPNNTPVLIHIPEAEIAGRIIIPDGSTANLSDLAFTPVTLHRNN